MTTMKYIYQILFSTIMLISCAITNEPDNTIVVNGEVFYDPIIFVEQMYYCNDVDRYHISISGEKNMASFTLLIVVDSMDDPTFVSVHDFVYNSINAICRDGHVEVYDNKFNGRFGNGEMVGYVGMECKTLSGWRPIDSDILFDVTIL